MWLSALATNCLSAPARKCCPVAVPAGKIVGGWKVAGILNYQSGPPQLVGEGNALAPYEGNNDNGDGFALPNIVPGQPLRNPARNTRDILTPPIKSS